jgi:ATP-dependent helicase IRC3
VRFISGTKGHFSSAHIEESDDVVICTLQPITRAYQKAHPQLENFLKAAGNKLLVVFDEAHHSPASSYCRFITALRDRFPQIYLLGLTATLTYTDNIKLGLKKIPEKIIY